MGPHPITREDKQVAHRRAWFEESWLYPLLPEGWRQEILDRGVQADDINLAVTHVAMTRRDLSIVAQTPEEARRGEARFWAEMGRRADLLGLDHLIASGELTLYDAYVSIERIDRGRGWDGLVQGVRSPTHPDALHGHLVKQSDFLRQQRAKQNYRNAMARSRRR